MSIQEAFANVENERGPDDVYIHDDDVFLVTAMETFCRTYDMITWLIEKGDGVTAVCYVKRDSFDPDKYLYTVVGYQHIGFTEMVRPVTRSIQTFSIPKDDNWQLRLAEVRVRMADCIRTAKDVIARYEG